MDAVSPQRPEKSPNRPNAPQDGDGNPQAGTPSGQSWRWLWGVLAIGIVAILLAVGTIKTTNSKSITYTKYMQEVTSKQVDTAQISNASGQITGKLKNGTSYTVQGPSPSLPNDVQTMRNDGVQVSFPTPSSSLLATLLPYLFIIGSGPPSSTSSAARPGARCRGSCRSAGPRPRPSATERPSTTFDDVAGYTGVKQEISEVVDFLKTPAPVQGDRGEDPQGRPAGRASRHRQDAHRPGRRR